MMRKRNRLWERRSERDRRSIAGFEVWETTEKIKNQGVPSCASMTPDSRKQNMHLAVIFPTFVLDIKNLIIEPFMSTIAE